MDVTVPEIPASYNAYRTQLRAFIAAHKPALEWKQRTGMRVPDRAEDVEALRGFVQALYDAGYVRARFRTEAGDPIEDRILEEELGGSGLQYFVGNPLASGALIMRGTPEQQATYLPPMARGDHIWTQLFSEPNAGSDLASLLTKAVRDGDDYVVNGQKVWSTWAQWADYGYLLARTEPVPGPPGISAFVLDMRSPGVEARPLREMTGTADFNEVFLDDVRVPAANLIGEPGQGWAIANASLMTERTGVGSGSSGGMLADLVGLARRHRRFGRPAIEDGSVRQAIGSLAARSRIQRALGYRLATKTARGEIDASDAPLSKIWFSELNLEMVEYALALQGPRSVVVEGDPLTVDDGKWQDAFLYARAWTIAGGTNEIMRNLIAERSLDLPKEPRGQQ